MKIFKVNFSCSNQGTKIKQSHLVKAPDEKTAATMLEVWKKSIHSDIENFSVTGCIELTEKQIKLSNPNTFITTENYDRWVKDKKSSPVVKSVTSTPGKVASKPVTQISWLPKKPIENTVASTPAKAASKPVTQISWLKKKPVEKSVASTTAKPVEKTETEWDKINALSHNRDFDNNK